MNLEVRGYGTVMASKKKRDVPHPWVFLFSSRMVWTLARKQCPIMVGPCPNRATGRKDSQANDSFPSRRQAMSAEHFGKYTKYIPSSASHLSYEMTHNEVGYRNSMSTC